MPEYTINELTGILGLSRTAVNRKIGKYKFETGQKYVDGVSCKVITISDEELGLLKKEVEKWRGVNTVTRHSYDTNLNNTNSQIESNGTSLTNDDIMEMIGTIKEFANKAIDKAESQTKLLTDQSQSKENDVKYYQDEYFKLKSTSADELSKKADELSKKTAEFTEEKAKLDKEKALLQKDKKTAVVVCIILGILSLCLIGVNIWVLTHAKTVTQEKQVTKIIKIDSKGNVVSTLTK